VPDVGCGIGLVEPVQGRLQADALLQLHQGRIVEIAIQLRLAAEDDLQQLLACGLQIGELADLLEHFRLEILRLVDDQERKPALFVLANQESVELDEQIAEVLSLRCKAEIAADIAEQLA